MLESLTIKNFALFKQEEIQFKKGLNLFLGETGSGKSLIFDAIHFVTGQKSDRSLIRSGEKSMRVDAIFTDLPNSVKNILEENDLETDQLILTRTLQEDGRSTFRINGQPVVASMVKNVSKQILDSLQQHEGLDLLKSKNHLLMLDKFGGEEIASLKQQLSALYDQRKTLENQLQSLGGSTVERERQKELYSYQINEIEKADLYLGEDDEIREKLEILTNAEKIYEITSNADDKLSNSALDSINTSISTLSTLLKIDSISECYDRLTSLRIELEDIIQNISEIKNSTFFDEIELNRLDSRQDLIKSLKRKYGSTIEEIFTYCDNLKEKLDLLEESEAQLERINKEISLNNVKLNEICGLLTEKRKKIAEKIESKIISELNDLGMKNTSFRVMFEDKAISIDGKDKVEFVFSANAGQSLKNLSKTASGGEVSRLMLSIKNIFAQVDGVGTLVFDEVDSGISGEVGNMVAEKLLNISKHTQVLCITHLPQVAALSDNFFLVKKETKDLQTETSILEIDENMAVFEIARLIGGNNVSDVALLHAKELRLRKAPRR